MIAADTCIRCQQAEATLGSSFCKPCELAVLYPLPPPPPPPKRRISPYHNHPKGACPR